MMRIDGDCEGRLPMRVEVLAAAINICVQELNPRGESALKQD